MSLLIISRMNWLIALGLLVAVAAWVLSVYHRLHHLQLRAQEAWALWETATRHRNACVEALVPVLAASSPRVPTLPGALRRAAKDSDQGLDLAGSGIDVLPDAHWLHPMGRQERSLRRLVADAFDAMDALPPSLADSELAQLGSALSISLFQQEQRTEQYNRAAESFNEALQTPSGRIVGSALRLSPAMQLAL